MEKSYNHLSKRKKDKNQTCSGPSRRSPSVLLSLCDPATAAWRVLFSFLKRFRGSFFVNERVLPCAYIMKAKTRSSEVIHKSNDPRRLRRLRTVFTDEGGIRRKIRLRVRLSPSFSFVFFLVEERAGQRARKNNQNETHRSLTSVSTRY